MKARVLQPGVDSIAAIATAQGRGGIGVVRVSGRNIDAIVLGILGKVPVPRNATFRKFIDINGIVIDQGIAIFFSAPNSFTGENLLELQGHGGTAVLQLLLQRCLELGARLAHPGEFTYRAFLNNKMDLTQAESVADLINANTAEAARCAIRSLCGVFSDTIREMVDELIHLRTLVEAMLDFPEEDVTSVESESMNILINGIISRLHNTLNIAKQGNLLSEGAHVVIAGQPNVGKSSLLNFLAGEEVALVSDIPGTTRDSIRQTVLIRGVPLHIMDTAGLRETLDVVESMGVARTHQMLHRADLILLLLDASKGITAEDEVIISMLPSDSQQILVFNKIDLLGCEFAVSVNSLPANTDFIGVSAKTGAGVEVLREKLLNAIGWRDLECGTFMARERHVRALMLAQSHLIRAQKVMPSVDFFAEELRHAQVALGEIVGEFTSEDLLGEIFSRFCIGK